MFKTLAATFPLDTDLPPRAHRYEVLTAVLDGALYDNLQHSFHEERTDGGQYIPLRKRRPSVRYALCRSVVDDSVGLLFSDGHFPAIECPDERTCEVLQELIKETNLVQTMIDGATRGSVGSVAFLMRVLKGRIFFSVLPTQYLTPEWDENEPDKLKRVTEQYKVKGATLASSGYDIADDDLNEQFWFRRIWDAQAETWFLPWRVRAKDGEKPKKPSKDRARTKSHRLGFVPLVWAKNLPGGDEIDGACTFSLAIDTNIEIDYQLSQAGRGLKYSADPLLLIKEPASTDEEMVRGGGNAIVVDADGDAKLLEIGGTAATAVIEYVAKLRELALESIHGSRTSPDKISVAQSGRAMELMQQSLIWLADKLRTSYGEGALLSLLRMVVLASHQFALKINGKDVKPPLPTNAPLSLRWPDWYDPTYTDRQAEATTLQILTSNGLLSKQSATKSLASDFDIEDVDAELAQIEAERSKAQEQALEIASSTPTPTPPSKQGKEGAAPSGPPMRPTPAKPAAR